MEVIALKKGFHEKLRNVGDIFTIKSEKQLGSWMEMSPNEARKRSKLRQAKRKQQQSRAGILLTADKLK